MKALLHLSIKVTCFCALIVLLGAVPLLGTAQSGPLVNNYGASWYFNPGSYMIVNDDSLHNHAGYIENGGHIRIDGSVYNDDTLAGGVGGSGCFDVGGDWVNNAVVISRTDSVVLNGDGLGSSGPLGNQSITGTVPTVFHTLVLAGTPGSVKSQTLDASVSGILDLRSSELATNNYEMKVVNSSPNALWKQANASGYVSSTGGGRLTRSTQGINGYLYPTGTPSSLVATGETFYYRPVMITPKTASVNEYSVRLVNATSSDGYDVTQHIQSITSVNDLYYHRLYHGAGSDPATIALYFNPSVDGMWTDITHHTGIEWDSTKSASAGTGLGLSSLSISDWNAFTPFPFALAKVTDVISPGVLFVPNAFTPNGDGNNDIFMPYVSDAQNLRMLSLVVFNRWGEKVFESNAQGIGWDGTYQGVVQNPGVYVWQVAFGYLTDTQAQVRKGSVTLIR